MKYIVLVITLVTLISCNDSKKEQPVNMEQAEKMMDKKSYMSILVDDPEEEGEKMLVGEIEADYLETERFSWYELECKTYKPEQVITAQLKEALKGKDITLFMGTWCEDSQREVPRLVTILLDADFQGNADLYAVSRDKDTPEGYEKGKNIEFVPTIIISEKGEEIGRIVESTQESLEKDLLAIATGKDYKHVYEE